MAETFSGAKLRERDKSVLEKHRTELAARDARYERLKQANAAMMKTKHAEAAQAEQFAQALGFRDLQEALLVVDLADHEVSYKGTVELVEGLRKEIESIRGENAELKDKLDDAEAKEHAQGKTIRAYVYLRILFFIHAKPLSRLEAEVAEVRSRYDEILNKKERLGERYKKDWEKWKNFKKAILDKEKKLRGLTDLTPEMIREVLTAEGGTFIFSSLDISPSDLCVALLAESEDKENDPRPKANKRSLSASPTRRKTSRPLCTPIASTSKRLLDPPRGCTVSSPFLTAASTDVTASKSLTPSDKINRPYRLPQVLAPDSDSETEDDSGGMFVGFSFLSTISNVSSIQSNTRTTSASSSVKSNKKDPRPSHVRLVS